MNDGRTSKDQGWSAPKSRAGVPSLAFFLAYQHTPVSFKLRILFIDPGKGNKHTDCQSQTHSHKKICAHRYTFAR
jgi:hypothetical protein